MPDYKYQCLDCGKTHIGPMIPGGMRCNCVPPKTIRGSLYTCSAPLPPAVLVNIPNKDEPKVRSELCRKWGIVNHSHQQHLTSYSSNRTLANLIDDIVSPVSGGLRIVVRQKIMKEYGYDIDS